MKQNSTSWLNNRYYDTSVSAHVKNYISTEEVIGSIKDVRRILDNLVRIQYTLQGEWKLNGKTAKVFDKLTTRIMDKFHFFKCILRSNFSTISCALLPKPVVKEGIVQIELIFSWFAHFLSSLKELLPRKVCFRHGSNALDSFMKLNGYPKRT